MTAKPVFYGIIASALLLGVYFVVLTSVSGWSFALSQFLDFWYFIISLAVGFGIQIGLYSYLKQLVQNSSMVMGGKTVVVTGTTSTFSMISCCAHYLVNIVPIIGIAGVLSVIAQYQVEIFWAGLVFNVFGIAFIGNKIIKFKKYHESRYHGLTAAVSIKALSDGDHTPPRVYTQGFRGNGMNKAITILAFVLIGGFFVFYNLKPVSNPIQDASSIKEIPQKWDTKSDDQPPISIRITPIEFGPDAKQWRFTVAFDTHSGILDQDPVRIAILSDDKSNIYKPISWEGPGPGGHHREGVLLFNAINPAPPFVELKIKNVGGVPERSFKWIME